MIDFIYRFAASCSGGGFLGFPTWYKYLDGTTETVREGGTDIGSVCTPKITSISDTWLIVAAVVEILLRIAAIAAVVLIVMGGIQFISSQGEPEKAAKARSTVINALVGLVIAVAATGLVSFVAGQFN
jgi:hypothetical protein